MHADAKITANETTTLAEMSVVQELKIQGRKAIR